MTELAGAELDLPEPTGDWRADMHIVAGRSPHGQAESPHTDPLHTVK